MDNSFHYVAGIIDGEGTITLTAKWSRGTKTAFRVPVVSVSSTTLAILEFLQARFGGHISKHKVYQDHHKQSWSWKVCYDGAINMCDTIYPLLLEPEKQRRAKMIALEYKNYTKRNGKYTADEERARLEWQDKFFDVVSE